MAELWDREACDSAPRWRWQQRLIIWRVAHLPDFRIFLWIPCTESWLAWILPMVAWFWVLLFAPRCFFCTPSASALVYHQNVGSSPDTLLFSVFAVVAISKHDARLRDISQTSEQKLLNSCRCWFRSFFWSVSSMVGTSNERWWQFVRYRDQTFGPFGLEMRFQDVGWTVALHTLISHSVISQDHLNYTWRRVFDLNLALLLRFAFFSRMSLYNALDRDLASSAKYSYSLSKRCTRVSLRCVTTSRRHSHSLIIFLLSPLKSKTTFSLHSSDTHIRW